MINKLIYESEVSSRNELPLSFLCPYMLNPAFIQYYFMAYFLVSLYWSYKNWNNPDLKLSTKLENPFTDVSKNVITLITMYYLSIILINFIILSNLYFQFKTISEDYSISSIVCS